jgi:hypothetical protein
MPRRRQSAINSPEFLAMTEDFYQWVRNEASIQDFILDILGAGSFNAKVNGIAKWLDEYLATLPADQQPEMDNNDYHDLIHTIDRPLQFGYARMLDYVDEWLTHPF